MYHYITCIAGIYSVRQRITYMNLIFDIFKAYIVLWHGL